ncbi:helix-turn-helix domain-containing protein [Marinoscillum sp.]|uniref:helix-turn-helix domain-containing protein n=1 Tax=Marinoscillum sp. TaxID=2024838 RepID=UPI003BAD8FC4
MNITTSTVTHKNNKAETFSTPALKGGRYSRIENGKTDPSVSTLERVAQALGVELAELFTSDTIQEVNSYDKTLMEKIRLMEGLSDEERKTIFTILEAFIGKKKLKDTLSSVLQDV